MDIEKLKNSHKLITEYKYEKKELHRGYANRALYVNIGDNTISEKAISEEVKEKFIGGRGVGLRMLWDGTKPETKWNDPENEIIISPGPIQTGYISPEMEKELIKDIPLGRVGRPEDIADAVVMLASEQAGWITGQLIFVHGGHRM